MGAVCAILGRVDYETIKKYPQLEEEYVRQYLRKLELDCKSLEDKQYREREWQELHKAEQGQHHIYHFFNEVDQHTCDDCIEDIGIWSRGMRTKQNIDDKITIIFNSPGGTVHHGLALYDYIQEVRSTGITVNTHAIGRAASMGGILLQAGGERSMGKNAYLLIHEVSSMDWGKTSEMEDELKFTKRLQKRLVEILAERSTFTGAQIEKRWKKLDWWLDADECLKYGFVDKIV